MERLRSCLRFFEDRRALFKTAVIIIIMIVAVLFYLLKGEKTELSGSIPYNASAGAGIDESIDLNEPAAAAKEIYVDIGGQVKNPGVYAVEDGARVFEVIEKAGGLTGDAAVDQFNRAETVTDGQKIWIPSEEELAEEGGGTGPAVSGAAANGKININTADSQTLQEIPGVGPATAEKIIAYRTEQGRFSSIEQLKDVSGIGEKTFQKMKDKITV